MRIRIEVQIEPRNPSWRYLGTDQSLPRRLVNQGK